jgi:hypothetical protein
MRIRAFLLVLALAASAAGCAGSNTATTPSATTSVVVLGAPGAPSGLAGFVIDTGGAGTSDKSLTCSNAICYETIQLQNTGPGCAGNVDGTINLYSAPANLNSLVTGTKGQFLIPNNPVMTPGQVVSVNVEVPMPASQASNYAVILVINYTTPTCP